jgi:hypothetical protein
MKVVLMSSGDMIVALPKELVDIAGVMTFIHEFKYAGEKVDGSVVGCEEVCQASSTHTLSIRNAA